MIMSIRSVDVAIKTGSLAIIGVVLAGFLTLRTIDKFYYSILIAEDCATVEHRMRLFAKTKLSRKDIDEFPLIQLDPAQSIGRSMRYYIFYKEFAIGVVCDSDNKVMAVLPYYE